MFHLNTTGEALDLGDPLEDARLKLLFGLDPDVAQEGSGHFRECALDQVEPGAMLWRVHVLEAPGAGAQIGHRLIGDVSRMVVQHHADDGGERGDGRRQLNSSMSALKPRFRGFFESSSPETRTQTLRHTSVRVLSNTE